MARKLLRKTALKSPHAKRTLTNLLTERNALLSPHTKTTALVSPHIKITGLVSTLRRMTINDNILSPLLQCASIANEGKGREGNDGKRKFVS